MRPPSELELSRFLAHVYDPTKSKDHYEKLKGRQPAKGEAPSAERSRGPKGDVARKTRDAKAQQRAALSSAVRKLESQLTKLEVLIKKRTSEETPKNPKAAAKRERAAKEKDKPKTAFAKAKVARGNKQLQHKQDGTPSQARPDKKPSLDELNTLATKVRGQIAVAKQKLAAL